MVRRRGYTKTRNGRGSLNKEKESGREANNCKIRNLKVIIEFACNMSFFFIGKTDRKGRRRGKATPTYHPAPCLITPTRTPYLLSWIVQYIHA